MKKTISKLEKDIKLTLLESYSIEKGVEEDPVLNTDFWLINRDLDEGQHKSLVAFDNNDIITKQNYCSDLEEFILISMYRK